MYLHATQTHSIYITEQCLIKYTIFNVVNTTRIATAVVFIQLSDKIYTLTAHPHNRYFELFEG